MTTDRQSNSKPESGPEAAGKTKYLGILTLFVSALFLTLSVLNLVNPPGTVSYFRANASIDATLEVISEVERISALLFFEYESLLPDEAEETSEAVSEAKSKAKMEVEATAEDESKVEAAAEVEAEIEASPDIEYETETEAESEAEAETDPDFLNIYLELESPYHIEEIDAATIIAASSGQALQIHSLSFEGHLLKISFSYPVTRTLLGSGSHTILIEGMLSNGCTRFSGEVAIEFAEVPEKQDIQDGSKTDDEGCVAYEESPGETDQTEVTVTSDGSNTTESGNDNEITEPDNSDTAVPGNGSEAPESDVVSDTDGTGNTGETPETDNDNDAAVDEDNINDTAEPENGSETHKADNGSESADIDSCDETAGETEHISEIPESNNDSDSAESDGV